MKRFTKIIGLIVCLLVATVALSGFGASAAPAKYDAAYFGCFDYEYQVGSKVEIPIMLSSCDGENQTFELKVVEEKTGKTVLKHSDNFPAEVGVTEYNYTLDTKGWESGDYYMTVSNMMDSSVLSTDSRSISLHDGIYENINTHHYKEVVVNNLSKPHTVKEYLEIPYGNGYINFSVTTVRYGETAEEFANRGTYYEEDYLYAPEGKEWVAFEASFNNYNDSGKTINVKDFISSYALVDKNGKAIKVYSYGNMGEYNSDNCWQGTVEVDDSGWFCFPALIDSSVGIPYLRLNTSKGTTYVDLNPVKEVNTLKQDAKDGKWYVYTNGVKNESFYGVVEANGKLWYANGGVVDFDFTGTTYYDDADYCIKNGAVDTAFTGFYSDGDYDNGRYFVNGIDDSSFVGIVEKDGGFVYVDYGRIDEWNTAVAPWNGTWWYVDDGVVGKKYEGLVSSDYGRCYIKDGKVNTAYTGLVFDQNSYDKVWYYVNKGVVDNDYKGLVYHAGGYYYVSSGIWQQYTDTMTEYDGNWYAVTNGRPDYKFTGVREYYHESLGEYRDYYFENGKINWSATGLKYVDEDPNDDNKGDWYYVNKGLVDYEYQGLVYHAGGYYYVEDGRWQENAEAMTQYGGTWYAVTKGRPDFKYTGIREYYHENLKQWKVYYFKNGKIDWNANGLCWHNFTTESKRDVGGEWVYIKNGVMQTEYTGLVNQAGAWWYVNNGWVCKEETLVYYGKTWYYVNNGVVDWNCNTLVKYNGVWYYAKNGAVNWNAETLVKYGNAWYAVKKGTVNWGYTGLINYANKWFYVQNGSVNWHSNTLVKYGNTYYYAKNGEVAWNAETLVNYGGTWYYVNKGAVDFKCDTLVKYGNSWYYVKNGVVDWKANKTVTYKGNNYKVVNGKVVF